MLLNILAAICEEGGHDVAQDAAKAVGFYKQLSERGHAATAFPLAAMYENERGVENLLENAAKASEIV